MWLASSLKFDLKEFVFVKEHRWFRSRAIILDGLLDPVTAWCNSYNNKNFENQER